MIGGILPVGTVLRRIRQVLEGDSVLSDAWIEGEVSRFQIWASGHAYFTIKDDEGVLDGTMWKAKLLRQRFIPKVGDQIIINGAITVYEARGALQLDANLFQPAGTGLLQAQLEALRQRLEADGLFDPSRKRELPAFPRRIGVVTSPSGAVWHDIQRVIERRYPLVHLILAPSAVQGPNAPHSIVAAIEALNSLGDIDVIVVARGGGSIEDLWGFNDERVVRAMFASRVPVVSAVGHETDFTLSDSVADLRAPTPSAAAELMVPDIEQLWQGVAGLLNAARVFFHATLQEMSADLYQATQRLHMASPLHRLELRDLAIDNLRARADRGLESVLTKHTSELERASALLGSLDPHAILRRGYTQLVQVDTGAVVNSVTALEPTRTVRAIFPDGEAELATRSITPTAARSQP